ncbi:hypothetical protein Tco_0524153 [Tanacetum coccineum]
MRPAIELTSSSPVSSHKIHARSEADSQSLWRMHQLESTMTTISSLECANFSLITVVVQESQFLTNSGHLSNLKETKTANLQRLQEDRAGDTSLWGEMSRELVEGGARWMTEWSWGSPLGKIWSDPCMILTGDGLITRATTRRNLSGLVCTSSVQLVYCTLGGYSVK